MNLESQFQPIAELPAAVARGIVGVFADIDDTISLHGRIPAPAFAALWRLREAGLRVVPVTGRPAGWVDHLARMWPVDGVVGENGGLYFAMRAGKLHKVFLQDARERASNRARLLAVQERILREVPGCALASDQPYRELDVAIDFCEDVARLGPAAIARIVALFEEAGCRCKVSSIHVNGWFGDFDKLTMAKRFARELYGEDLDDPRARAGWLYVGDSPNDEPMFEFFPNAVGVHNLLDFAAALTHRPRWLTRGAGGAGFAECVEVLLRMRSASHVV